MIITSWTSISTNKISKGNYSLDELRWVPTLMWKWSCRPCAKNCRIANTSFGMVVHILTNTINLRILAIQVFCSGKAFSFIHWHLSQRILDGMVNHAWPWWKKWQRLLTLFIDLACGYYAWTLTDKKGHSMHVWHLHPPSCTPSFTT